MNKFLKVFSFFALIGLCWSTELPAPQYVAAPVGGGSRVELSSDHELQANAVVNTDGGGIYKIIGTAPRSSAGSSLPQGPNVTGFLQPPPSAPPLLPPLPPPPPSAPPLPPPHADAGVGTSDRARENWRSLSRAVGAAGAFRRAGQRIVAREPEPSPTSTTTATQTASDVGGQTDFSPQFPPRGAGIVGTFPPLFASLRRPLREPQGPPEDESAEDKAVGITLTELPPGPAGGLSGPFDLGRTRGHGVQGVFGRHDPHDDRRGRPNSRRGDRRRELGFGSPPAASTVRASRMPQRSALRQGRHPVSSSLPLPPPMPPMPTFSRPLRPSRGPAGPSGPPSLPSSTTSTSTFSATSGRSDDEPTDGEKLIASALPGMNIDDLAFSLGAISGQLRRDVLLVGEDDEELDDLDVASMAKDGDALKKYGFLSDDQKNTVATWLGSFSTPGFDTSVGSVAVRGIFKQALDVHAQRVLNIEFLIFHVEHWRVLLSNASDELLTFTRARFKDFDVGSFRKWLYDDVRVASLPGVEKALKEVFWMEHDAKRFANTVKLLGEVSESLRRVHAHFMQGHGVAGVTQAMMPMSHRIWALAFSMPPASLQDWAGKLKPGARVESEEGVYETGLFQEMTAFFFGSKHRGTYIHDDELLRYLKKQVIGGSNREQKALGLEIVVRTFNRKAQFHRWIIYFQRNCQMVAKMKGKNPGQDFEPGDHESGAPIPSGRELAAGSAAWVEEIKSEAERLRREFKRARGRAITGAGVTTIFALGGLAGGLGTGGVGALAALPAVPAGIYTADQARRAAVSQYEIALQKDELRRRQAEQMAMEGEGAGGDRLRPATPELVGWE